MLHHSRSVPAIALPCPVMFSSLPLVYLFICLFGCLRLLCCAHMCECLVADIRHSFVGLCNARGLFSKSGQVMTDGGSAHVLLTLHSSHNNDVHKGRTAGFLALLNVKYGEKLPMVFNTTFAHAHGGCPTQCLFWNGSSYVVRCCCRPWMKLPCPSSCSPSAYTLKLQQTPQTGAPLLKQPLRRALRRSVALMRASPVKLAQVWAVAWQFRTCWQTVLCPLRTEGQGLLHAHQQEQEDRPRGGRLLMMLLTPSLE